MHSGNYLSLVLFYYFKMGHVSAFWFTPYAYMVVVVLLLLSPPVCIVNALYSDILTDEQ